ncbi:MAG TPA: hypothetical protein DDZ89_20550 [Clostridiales bacterium]|nr:hypothetical protein [Clostridiales bacterium]
MTLISLVLLRIKNLSCIIKILPLFRGFFMKNFDKNEIEGLLFDFFSSKAIESDTIPDIDLYMDQVTTFIEGEMGSLKRKNEDKMLTKTMINNYTKEGILFPPVLKKYTKNHIKMLVMIYYCKQVLSINDVKAILKPLSDNIKPPDSKEGKSNGKKNTESVDLDFLEKLYETFLSIEESKRNEFQIAMTDMMNRIETIDEELFNRSWVLLMVIDLVLQAHMRKAMAEKLIDTYIATDEE